ncbi:sphingosine kinase [Penicillium citrinum]|uniref:Sphingosine kinase n=1 Tax=Penicillium citrinum TaxID=5077 RepID=A0A9W9NER9_PENCI|nr:sphingosine kinase [Penicillium citrinum]KAJ5217599.1 sphingosine kinase [Penicillium citrinum]
MDPPTIDKTFRVDESRSLTLLRESLVLHDLGPKNISFDAVLNAQLSPNGLTITYVDKDSTTDGPLNALQYPVGLEQTKKATIWKDHLLDRAYGLAQRRKRLKVLVNPFCGSALTNFRTYAAPIFAAAHCEVDLEETRHRGHASEIAEKIDLDSYDAIVCCSGDGLPYEVFNGLARRSDALNALSSVAVAMIPCGSGNAMAWNLFGTDDPSLAALGIVKGLEMPLDLASITQGERHTVSFLSQSLGVLADSDLKTEHLRWMGDHRFIYGVIATIARNTKYPCQLAFKSAGDEKRKIEKHPRRTRDGPSSSLPLQYGTVLDDIPQDWEIMPREELASFYAGNMCIVAKDTNFFPDALPNDGSLDIMMVDDTIGYAGALEAIIKLPQGRCHELKDVEMRKVSAYRMSPWKQDGDISVDGERYPFEAFQVEVHRGIGRVLSKSGNSYRNVDV